MADGAHRETLAAHARRIEARPMWIEPPPALRRMAGQTVAFGVAADAGLETLARGLTMACQEELSRIMIPGPQHARGDQPGTRVARGAKRSDVVAIAARRLTGVRGGGMPRQKSVRVITSGAPWAGPMALQAIGADVASRAAGGRCSCCGAVTVGIVGTVTRRRGPGHDGRRSRIGRQPRDRARRRRAGMTLVAELACVAGRAGGSHRLTRNGAVTTAAQKRWCGMRRWRGDSGDVLPREGRS